MADDPRPMTRRTFGAMAGAFLASVAFAACDLDSDLFGAGNGRLAARPREGVATSAVEGPLGVERTRDAILHLPPSTTGPLPLLVLLHGAGGSGPNMLRRLGSAPDDAGVAVLAPTSRDASWDAIRDGYGPDVDALDRALRRVFDTVAIDPARLAIGGFSDGATYALSLGLINGDLFRRVVAFSPGFVIDGAPHGRPRVFISHGTADDILPIDRCGRRIAASLKQQGYDVTFREFNGVHEVPAGVAREAMHWMTAGRPDSHA